MSTFTLDDDERGAQPGAKVPGTSITIRSKVAEDTSKPIAATIEGDDDPLLKIIRDRKNRSPAEIEAERLELQARQDAVDADRRAIALRDWEASCPPRLRVTEWHDPRLKPYLVHIRKVTTWKRGGQGIYAVGQSGKGKSRALWALTRRLAVEELLAVRYLVQGEIVNDVNRTGLNSWLEKIDALKNCPILAWDDFGAFAAMAARKEVLATELFELIDYRFNRELPFLITSNARSADLAGIFGDTRAEPLMRRLTEGATVIDFDQSTP